MADLDVQEGPSVSVRSRIIATDEASRAAILALAALVVFFGPVPLAIVGAVVFVVLASRDRLGPLSLIIVTLPFSPLVRQIGSYAFSPVEILTVLTAVGALLDISGRALAGPRTKTAVGATGSKPVRASLRQWLGSATGIERGDPITTALVSLVVLFAAVSLTASVAKHESLQSFRVIVVEPAVFFFLAMRVDRRHRAPLVLGLALVLAGVLIALVGLWQYANDERIITAEAELRRIRGFYGSPNNLGLFLGRAIPISFALSLWWRRGRIPLLSATGLMIVALILTFSIGAWIAVAMSLALVAVLRGRRAALYAGLVGVGAILVVAGAAVSVPRIGSHFDLQSGTSSIRLDVWTSGARMVLDHPIRGIGLDNFLYYYQHGYRLPSAWQDPNLSHPHNVLLDFWLSLGIVGPVLLGVLIVRFVVLVRQSWTVGNPIDRALLAGASGGLADILLHGLVDNSFFLPDLAMLFWLMFGIVALVSETATRSPNV